MEERDIEIKFQSFTIVGQQFFDLKIQHNVVVEYGDTIILKLKCICSVTTSVALLKFLHQFILGQGSYVRLGFESRKKCFYHTERHTRWHIQRQKKFYVLSLNLYY